MMRREKSAVGSGRWAAIARRAARARSFRTAHCPLPAAHFSRGMTLIELLVTMTIIAIISAAILGTASAAFESARRTRTQTLVTRISGLLLERWDSYATQRVDVHPDIIAAINALYPAQINAAARGQMLADARLLALRERMKMEMPDQWTDVVNNPSVLAGPPGLVQAYRRVYAQISSHPEVNKHQSAECLYLVVMNATGDGEARTLFSSQDIGDVDGDGAPEFLDGWGQPIKWIRWPSGFTSDLQPRNPDGSRPEGDHDPFDVFRRDSVAVQIPPVNSYPPALRPHIEQIRIRNQKLLRASRLVPLVYSAGPDQEIEEPGYWFFEDGSPLGTSLDPYQEMSDGTQQGQTNIDKDTWRDNIHNHLNSY